MLVLLLMWPGAMQVVDEVPPVLAVEGAYRLSVSAGGVPDTRGRE